MRNYCYQKNLSVFSALGRLNNGGYCAMCARSTGRCLDLCSYCEELIKGCRLTLRDGRHSLLCARCGNETTDPLRSKTRSGQPGSGCQSPAEHDRSSLPTKPSVECVHCKFAQRPLFTNVLAPYRYAFPLDKLIHRMKYGDQRQLSRVFGGLLGRAASQQMSIEPLALRPDVLLPMPLSREKLASRGFNQALDIARWTGNYLKLPVSSGALSRVADTGSLAGLNRQERQQRILGVFRASETLRAKRVVIVDDVMTTGSSARELAREIYDSGASSVELWVLARTSSTREAD